MVNFLQLPAYNSGNALDFSQVNNAIDTYQKQNQLNHQNKLQQAHLGLAQNADSRAAESHGIQMQSARTAQALQEARTAAGRVQGIMSLPADQRPAAWAAARQMPGFRELPAEYDNFEFAAPQIISRAREYMSEKDQAQLGLIKGQTAAAYAQAQRARMGGETPANIREWQSFQQMTPEQQRQYLTMKRADRYYDVGTGYARPDSMNPSGPPVAVLPKDVAGKAEQTKLGEWAGGAPQRDQGKKRLDTLLGGLAQDYMTLDRSGGIVNPDRGMMDNVIARARSSGPGQAIAGATGSKEQSIRQQINNSRPLLIQGIMQATGMSARSLDSNRELDFYLQAVTNPQSDLHSNLVALDALDKTYGLGGVLQRSLPPEVYERVSRDSQLALARRPIPRNDDPQQGAPQPPPSPPPSGGGWSIQRVD